MHITFYSIYRSLSYDTILTKKSRKGTMKFNKIEYRTQFCYLLLILVTNLKISQKSIKILVFSEILLQFIRFYDKSNIWYSSQNFKFVQATLTSRYLYLNKLPIRQMYYDESKRTFVPASKQTQMRKIPRKLEPIQPQSEEKLLRSAEPLNFQPLTHDDIMAKNLLDRKTSIIDTQEIYKQVRDRPVPIFKMQSTSYRLKLTNEINKQKLNVQQSFRDTNAREFRAKGTLLGNYEGFFKWEDQQVEVQFQGNFQGQFETQEGGDGRPVYYFEGLIQELKFIKIDNERIGEKQKDLYKNVTAVRGFFKGEFLHPDNSIVKFRQSDIVPRKSNLIQYYVPVFVRIDIREITNIDMEACSADIVAYVKIDVQLNQEVAAVFKKEWKDGKKPQLGVEFNRNKALVLPFFDRNDENYQFADSEQQTEYQWDEKNADFDVDESWDDDKCRMSYVVRSTFTTQIDNTYGVFYAPCNLNNLRMVLTFNKITIDNYEINMTNCDLQDYRYQDQKYSPYAFSDQLQIDSLQKTEQNRLHRQIDRITKIRTIEFRDQGEFNIADNRTHMFPYHKNINQNSDTQTNDIFWLMGVTRRKDYLIYPEVFTVKQAFTKAVEEKNNEGAGIFKIKKWQYCHIGVPIYKYVVIDLISIYVPIIILSVISLLFFSQENGKNEDDFVSLSKRIATGASILLAYIGLLPIIRQRIPPSPAITFLQLVVYFSTVPNILGVIAALTQNTIRVPDFFASYIAFKDVLFIISFVFVIGSFGTLSLSLIMYLSKQYRLRFRFSDYTPSDISRMRNPMYMGYMYALKKKRPQLNIQEFQIQYKQAGNQ